jgi:hypothetical protein
VPSSDSDIPLDHYDFLSRNFLESERDPAGGVDGLPFIDKEAQTAGVYYNPRHKENPSYARAVHCCKALCEVGA